MQMMQKGARDDPNRVPTGDSGKPQAYHLTFFGVWLIINGFADLTLGFSSFSLRQYEDSLIEKPFNGIRPPQDLWISWGRWMDLVDTVSVSITHLATQEGRRRGLRRYSMPEDTRSYSQTVADSTPAIVLLPKIRRTRGITRDYRNTLHFLETLEPDIWGRPSHRIL